MTTSALTDTMIATSTTYGWCIVDTESGVWWPTDRAETEADVLAAYTVVEAARLRRAALREVTP